MGRKRKNEIIAGSQVILYLPQDIDQKVLDFLNSQTNISKTLLELIYSKLYQPEITENVDIKSIAKLVEEELKKTGNTDIKVSTDSNRKSSIMKLKMDSMFNEK